MINYSLNKDNILYVTFSEKVTVEDIKNYLLEFEKIDNMPQYLLSLYDLRSCELVIENKDIAIISELTDYFTRKFQKVRTAFLVDKPNLTAYSILFSEELVPKRTKREVFSTEEAALIWLKSNI